MATRCHRRRFKVAPDFRARRVAHLQPRFIDTVHLELGTTERTEA
jgi:hypothetical protein